MSTTTKISEYWTRLDKADGSRETVHRDTVSRRIGGIYEERGDAMRNATEAKPLVTVAAMYFPADVVASRLAQDDAGDAMEVAERPERFETT